MRRLGCFGLVLVLGTHVGVAFAQSRHGVDLGTTPSIAGDSGFWVQDAAVSGDGTLRFAATLDFAHDPLTLITPELVNDHVALRQVWAHWAASYSLWHRYALGVSVPTLLDEAHGAVQTSAGASRPTAAPTLGDVSIRLRAQPFGEPSASFHASPALVLWLPTGDQAAYASDGAVRAGASVVLGGQRGDFRWSLEPGVRTRPSAELPGAVQVRVGSELFAGMRGSWPIDTPGHLRFGPEAMWVTTFGNEATLLDSLSSAVSALLVANLRPMGGPIDIAAGVGTAVGDAPGAADVRGLLRISWAPWEKPPPPDADRDGIEDRFDACLEVSGIPAADPLMNGCPELPLDTDGDGIPNAHDACPTEAGRATAFRKTHGCPKPVDRDADGILDEVDACPDQRGVASELPAKNGCPAVEPPKAVLSRTHIEISQQVQFATGTAELLSESEPLLEQVRGLLAEHPEILRVEVQGHTDSMGTNEFNRELSQARAASVVAWLVAHGVEAARLSAQGFGETRPLAENTTEAGRSKNRRVEFLIQEAE